MRRERNLRDDESFDARRADPRQLYEHTGFFGGPKRKFRLSMICLCIAILLGAASAKIAQPHWIHNLVAAISGLSFVAALFLGNWYQGEDYTLNRPDAKDSPTFWRRRK
jgi:hypothetical protein